MEAERSPAHSGPPARRIDPGKPPQASWTDTSRGIHAPLESAIGPDHLSGKLPELVAQLRRSEDLHVASETAEPPAQLPGVGDGRLHEHPPIGAPRDSLVFRERGFLEVARGGGREARAQPARALVYGIAEGACFDDG